MSDFMVDILYQIDRPHHPTEGYRPWYTRYSPSTSSGAFDARQDIVLGVAFREKYTSIEPTSDLDAYIEQVEDVCLHVEWFDPAIDAEVLGLGDADG